METANGLKKIRVRVQGITPLLMNRMTQDQVLGLRTKRKAAKSKTNDETPREEAARKVYTDSDGRAYIPTENLMSCLIGAGSYIRLDGKRQMSTSKGSIVPGFLALNETHLGLEEQQWEVDIRPGRNPNGGEAVCLVRPRFDRWGFTVTLLLDTMQVSETLCRELFDIALSRVGLGDFRPARKGTFGRSVIVGWEVL